MEIDCRQSAAPGAGQLKEVRYSLISCNPQSGDVLQDSIGVDSLSHFKPLQ